VREKSSAVTVCTIAGTLLRSKPRPVIGVGAMTWNAGSALGAGAGAGAAGGVRAASRRGAGAARRGGGLGAARGAVTVTSGSVSDNCPQADPSKVGSAASASIPNATACMSRRFLAVKRDDFCAPPAAPGMATPRRTALPTSPGGILDQIPGRRPVSFCQFGPGTFGNVAFAPHTRAA
jgi:hypothetical protein